MYRTHCCCHHTLGLWGFLGRNDNVTLTKYVESLKELIRLSFDDTIDITDTYFVSDEQLVVQYKKFDGEQDLDSKANVFLAALTTA